MKEPHSAAAKPGLAEALWLWLTDHAWTVWKCHLKINHFISVTGENDQDGARPGEGLIFHLSCVALSTLTVPAHLWLRAGERAQHSSESLDSSLSCSTCEMGKGDGVNTQGTEQPALELWEESCSVVFSGKKCCATQGEQEAEALQAL